MPVRILQNSPDGKVALVEFPEGRTIWMPAAEAADAVRSDSGSDQNPMQFPPDVTEHAVRSGLEMPPAQGPAPNNYVAAPDVTEHAMREAVPMQMPPDVTEHAIRQANETPAAPVAAPPVATPAAVPPPSSPAPTTAGNFAPQMPPLAGSVPAQARQLTPNGAYGAERPGGRTHAGIDLVATEGAPTKSILPFNGRVTRVGQTVGDQGRGGNRVEIDYGDGIKASLMHMSGFNVKEKDEVGPDTILGTSGNTGTSSSGAHDHWQISIDGKLVSPDEAVAAIKQRKGVDVQIPGAGGILPGGTRVSGSYSGQSGATPPITDPSQVPMANLPPNYDPTEYLAGLKRAQDVRAGAADLELQAQLGQIGAQEQQSGRLQAEQARAIAAQEHAGQLAMQERAQYEQNIQQAMQQVGRVDPGRVWKNAGFLGSAAGLFSAAVGGWLQVLHGGPNQNLNAIMKMIDQDIQAQETDIATQREGVFRAERASERGEGYIRDRYQRLEEGRMMRLAGLMERGKAEMLKYESPIARAKHAETLAALEERYLESFAKAGQYVQEKAMERHLNSVRITQAEESLRQGREQLSIAGSNAETARSAKAAEDAAGSYTYDPDTRQKVHFDPSSAHSKDDRSKVALRQAHRRDVGQAVKDYYALLKRVGRGYGGWLSNKRGIGSEDQQLLDAAFSDVQSRLTKERSGAAFTEQELEVYRKMIGPPPKETGLDPTKSVRQFIRKLGTEEFHEFNSLGSRNDDGSAYNPYEFYLKLPDDGRPEEVSINELRDNLLRSDQASDIVGSLETYADLMEIPGQQEAFHQNFPDLYDEAEAAMLRGLSDNKGNPQAVSRIQESWREFSNAWMKRRKEFGAGHGELGSKVGPGGTREPVK